MSQYTKAELDKALNKAKIDLMSQLGRKFLATIVWSLKQHFSDSVPTAGTNGIDLILNPDWFMGLTRGQRVGLLAHEAWHVALEHMVRGEAYDNRIYNIAADYVINIMEQDKGTELPPHVYCDPQYRDMTTEQVYNLIYGKEKQNPSADYDLDIQYPSEGDKDGKNGMTKDEIKARVESTIIKAHITAEMSEEKGCGDLPGELLRRIEELTNPKLPWNVILQNFVTAYAKTEYSYARPKKKIMAASGIFLPSLSGRTIGHLCCAIDSSGSVYDHEFTQFLQEISTIKDSMQPTRITIIDFDSNIKAVHTLEPDDDLWSVEFHGYGGTNLEPPFEKAKELNPDLFIVFTDLGCAPIEEEPPFPVIWVAVNNPTTEVNFGMRLDLETQNVKN